MPGGEPVSTPKLARKGTGSRRYYQVGDERLWSVTTILQAVPKPALTYWAARETAAWVADNYAAIGPLIDTDRDAAIDMMKGAPWRQRNKAADLGTLVHAVAEAHVLGQELPEWPEEADGYLNSLLAFMDDFQPEWSMAEATVASLKWRYAGTLDGIFTIGGRALIEDVKTGKDVYPEAALQLAAYRFAEFVVMPDGSQVEMPKVEGGVVLHLLPDGYRLIPVRCDEEVFRAFLQFREAFRWMEATSQAVIGDPVSKGA
jgi:hypothetical protein